MAETKTGGGGIAAPAPALWSRPDDGSVELADITRIAQLGTLVEGRIAGRQAWYVNDRASVWRMLTQDAPKYRKSTLLSKARRYLDGSAILAVGGIDRRSQRQLIQPLLSRPAVSRYGAEMAGKASHLAGTWSEGTVDVLRRMCGMSASISLGTMFAGTAPATSARMEPLLESVTHAVIHSPIMAAHSPFAEPVVRIDQARQAAQRELRALIDDAVADTGSGILSGSPALCGSAAAQDGAPQVGAEILLLMVSATVTTAVAATWALHLAARHGFYGPAHVHRLVAETLRLYPPLWLFAREAREEVEVDGTLYPAGSVFAFSPYTFQRDPGLYHRPQMFDPDRWPPGGTRDTDGRSLLAFGMGARDCIGEAFAWQHLTAVLTAVTRRWELHPHDPDPPEPVGHMLLHPRHSDLSVAARAKPAG